MGRHRCYASNAEKQAAYRQRQRDAVLHQIPVVHGESYTLYQGDAEVLVPMVGPFDHCITDPPYEAEAHTRTRRTRAVLELSLIHISEPTRLLSISYAVF